MQNVGNNAWKGLIAFEIFAAPSALSLLLAHWCVLEEIADLQASCQEAVSRDPQL